MKIVISKSPEDFTLKAVVHTRDWLLRPKRVGYTCLGVDLLGARWSRLGVGDNRCFDPISCLQPIYSKLNEAGKQWQLAGCPDTFTARV